MTKNTLIKEVLLLEVHTLDNYPRHKKGLFAMTVIIKLDQIDYERILELGGPLEDIIVSLLPN